MSSQRIKPVHIKLGDKDYEMRVDFNCFCELEDIYGEIDILFEKLKKPSLKDLRNCIYASIKYQDEKLTPLKVGQLIAGFENIKDLNRKIMDAIADSLPKADENEKNAAAQEQTEEK